MAFNLGAFVGGFSEKLTERIEEEEERVNKRIEEERQLAMKQRMARQAKRDKEKAYAEETLGLLSMLGYNDEIAGEIMKKGKGATEFAINTGQQALGKMDVNALWTLPSVSGDMGSDDQKIIDSTLTGEEAVMAQNPLTAGVSEEPTGGGFGLNQELYAQLYAPPNEYENTFSARLAKISQQKVRTTDPDKLNALELEETQLLDDLKRMKERERENTGSNTPSFNLGTVSSATNAVRKSQLNSVGFKTDLEGNIVGDLEGREGAYYAAELATAQALQTTYGSLGDQAMNDNIQTIQNNARNGIIAYGKRQQYLESVGKGTSYFQGQTDAKTVEENINKGMYKVGDVIQVQTKSGIKIVVYTGVADPNTGMPFIMG